MATTKVTPPRRDIVRAAASRRWHFLAGANPGEPQALCGGLRSRQDVVIAPRDRHPVGCVKCYRARAAELT